MLATCAEGEVRVEGGLYLVLALVRICRHPGSPSIRVEGMGVARNHRSRIFSARRYRRGNLPGPRPADKERQRPPAQEGKVVTILPPPRRRWLRPLWLRGCHQGDP